MNPLYEESRAEPEAPRKGLLSSFRDSITSDISKMIVAGATVAALTTGCGDPSQAKGSRYSVIGPERPENYQEMHERGIRNWVDPDIDKAVYIGAETSRGIGHVLYITKDPIWGGKSVTRYEMDPKTCQVVQINKWTTFLGFRTGQSIHSDAGGLSQPTGEASDFVRETARYLIAKSYSAGTGCFAPTLYTQAPREEPAHEHSHKRKSSAPKRSKSEQKSASRGESATAEPIRIEVKVEEREAPAQPQVIINNYITPPAQAAQAQPVVVEQAPRHRAGVFFQVTRRRGVVQQGCCPPQVYVPPPSYVPPPRPPPRYCPPPRPRPRRR